MSAPSASPVSSSERIVAIDVLRGFALLGILLMNITTFGMHEAAYDDPTVTGGASGPNLAVWAFLHVFAEGKMRCLFSLVFGASVILLTSRIESRHDSADIYYRRTFWLLLFGIAHAYLLWIGEILYPYALCGLLLYPFRNLSAKRLTIIGAAFLICTSVSAIGFGFEQKETIEKGRAALAAERQGKKLTLEQQDEKREYEDWRKEARPTAEELKRDADRWRGNVGSVIEARADALARYHGEPYYSPWNWDIWSMMFLGMGFMKMGILNASLPTRSYWWMLLAGYGIGIPLNSYTAWVIVQNNFDPVIKDFTAGTYDAGRLSIALGHLALIMLLSQWAAAYWFTKPLAAIGQTAFSNYVLQSILCTFFFTGYGLAMYGRLERYQLYYVVAAVWTVNLIVSPLWLRYYRFGPLEWVWRSLTYWKPQKLRLKSPVVLHESASR